MGIAEQGLERQAQGRLVPSFRQHLGERIEPNRDRGQRLEDRQFLAMELAYRLHGGFATGDELTRRLRRHVDQPLSRLAKWIVARDVVCISWQAQTLMPLFQFDLAGMTVRSDATRILRELTDIFDDWEIAVWFSQANQWLADRTPVDALVDDPAAVLDAARADRFIARG